jgi:hypothetical protein
VTAEGTDLFGKGAEQSARGARTQAGGQYAPQTNTVKPLE